MEPVDSLPQLHQANPAAPNLGVVQIPKVGLPPNPKPRIWAGWV